MAAFRRCIGTLCHAAARCGAAISAPAAATLTGRPPPIERAMDDKDRRLLQLLQQDARAPLKTLAADVGLARSSVRERIAKLEQAGVIRGYRADLGDALAPGDVRAFLLLKLLRTPLPETIRRINALPGTRRCYSVSGEIDLVVEVGVTSMRELNDHRDAVARLAGVADVTTMPVLRVERE
jgi:DNA-binding Lrp family transcriptional regulator